MSTPMTAQKPDGALGHFVRYLLIGLVMGIIPIVNIVWFAIALSKTGRRKRDLLMLLIPIWGLVVHVQTVWRYTARNIYWSVRSDRPSSSLFAGS